MRTALNDSTAENAWTSLFGTGSWKWVRGTEGKSARADNIFALLRSVLKKGALARHWAGKIGFMLYLLPVHMALADPPPEGKTINDIILTDDAAQLEKLLRLGLSMEEKILVIEGHAVMGMLEYSCMVNSAACIKLLRDRGADLFKVGLGGKIPIEILLDGKRPELAELLRVEEVQPPDSERFDQIIAAEMIRSRDGDEFPSHTTIKTVNGKAPSLALTTLIQTIEEVGRFKADGAESIDIKTLTFEVTHADPFSDDDATLIMKCYRRGSLDGTLTAEYYRKFGYWLARKRTPADH